MDTQVTHMYQRDPNDQSPTGLQRSNNGSNSRNGGSPRNNSRQALKLFLLILGIVLVFWALPQIFSPGSKVHGQNVGELPYSAFYQQVQAGNVKDATFQGQDITGDFKNAISLTDANGNPVLATQYHLTQFPNGDPHLITLLNQYHVQFQAKPATDPNVLLSIVFNFLSFILVFGVIFFMNRPLSLRFSQVSLKERMPNGIKQVISKPFEHKVVAQLTSWPGVPKKCKERVPSSMNKEESSRRKHP